MMNAVISNETRIIEWNCLKGFQGEPDYFINTFNYLKTVDPITKKVEKVSFRWKVWGYDPVNNQILNYIIEQDYYISDLTALKALTVRDMIQEFSMKTISEFERLKLRDSVKGTFKLKEPSWEEVVSIYVDLTE